MPTQESSDQVEKLSLPLTAAEIKLVLRRLICLDNDAKQVVKNTATGQPVLMTRFQLDEFGQCVADEVERSRPGENAKKLQVIHGKIKASVGDFKEDEPTLVVTIEDAPSSPEDGAMRDKSAPAEPTQLAEPAKPAKAKRARATDPDQIDRLLDRARRLSDAIAQAENLVKQSRFKNLKLDNFHLDASQREWLGKSEYLSEAQRRKLAKEETSFTPREVIRLISGLKWGMSAREEENQAEIMIAIESVVDQIRNAIAEKGAEKAAAKAKSSPRDESGEPRLFQFRITLSYIAPPSGDAFKCLT